MTMMNPTFFPCVPCNASPLQTSSVTNVNLQPTQNFPGGHKVVMQFPKNLKAGDCVIEILEEKNAWSLDGYTDPNVDYVNSDLDWGQLKPDVADSLLTDMVLSMEDNWDASTQEVIRPVANPNIVNAGPVNRNKPCQAWFPFYQNSFIQNRHFPTRVHLGAGVSVPQQFMPMPLLFTTPKSRKVSTRKRRRSDRECCQPQPLSFTKMARQG